MAFHNFFSALRYNLICLSLICYFHLSSNSVWYFILLSKPSVLLSPLFQFLKPSSISVCFITISMPKKGVTIDIIQSAHKIYPFAFSSFMFVQPLGFAFYQYVIFALFYTCTLFCSIAVTTVNCRCLLKTSDATARVSNLVRPPLIMLIQLYPFTSVILPMLSFQYFHHISFTKLYQFVPSQLIALSLLFSPSQPLSLLLSVTSNLS